MPPIDMHRVTNRQITRPRQEPVIDPLHPGIVILRGPGPHENNRHNAGATEGDGFITVHPPRHPATNIGE